MIRRFFLTSTLAALALTLSQCRSPVDPAGSSTPAAVGGGSRPQIVNVSLIARAGKGGNLDSKCANFLTAADRVGMLPGIYYRLQTHLDAVVQADQFIDRALALSRSRDWTASSLLLVADFDAQSSLDDILRFMDRVESRTGVVPVAYLENSGHLKLLLSGADEATKTRLRRMPYWLALYSHDKGSDPKYPQFPVPVHPEVLARQYNVWPDWTIWQYGGVEWSGGRSQPKVYSHGGHRYPTYFGDLDRPVERNVFNGSGAELNAFWQKHGLALR